MEATTIDARGLACPRPLVLTRASLKSAPAGAAMTVLVDNDTACQNVERFLRDHGIPPRAERDGSTWTIRFVAPGMESQPALPSPAPPVPTTTSPATWVVSLAGDTVGRGPPELGAVLVKSMLGTLPSLPQPPSHVVLYASGVLLGLEGSPVLGELQALEGRGVRVLLCGTCVDWYQRRAAVRVGTVTDMLSILEVLGSAGKVLAP